MPVFFRFILWAITLHVLFGASIPQVLAEEDFRLTPWQIIQTRHTTIKYRTTEDLMLFHTHIRFGPVKWNRSLELENMTQEEITAMVRDKVDALFVRAQEILDMKKRFEPVNILVHGDEEALKRAYESIYSGECRIRAWYRFKTNTVYLNAQDLNQGILAHELAHAIIDHYLTIKPPPQTAEILARYVDSHLDRGFISN